MEIYSEEGKITDIVVVHKGKRFRFASNLQPLHPASGVIERPNKAVIQIKDAMELENLMRVLERVSQELKNRYEYESFKYTGWERE